MRIVFLCDQYPPVVWDGAGTYTHTAAHALAGLGHDVHVVCCQGRRWVEKVDGRVSVHCRPVLIPPLSRLLGPFRHLVLGPHHPRDSLGLRATLVLSYAFWMRVLGLRPDVVETQDGESRALIQALMGTVPLVICLHAPTMLGAHLQGAPLGWRGHLADRVDRLSADRAHTLTSFSQLLVDTLRTIGWLENREPMIIPPPFHAEPWTTVPPVVDTDRTVLSVGRLEWIKGSHVLVEALAGLGTRAEGARAVFAGSSSGLVEGRAYQAWLDEHARSLGVAAQFLGAVPPAEMNEVYGRARVVAVPSRFESFSMVALEAMASGRPVVCSSRSGVAPLVERWGAGAVVEPDKPEELAGALLPFLDSPEASAEAGERGRACVRRELDTTTVARLREGAYRNAIDRHRRLRQRHAEAPSC